MAAPSSPRRTGPARPVGPPGQARAATVGADETVEQVFGQAAGQLTGRRLSELVHPDEQAGIPDPTALPPGQTLVHVCRIGTEGDWRYIESTATNLLADPDVAGVVLNSRDISDRKALEQQLTHRRSTTR